ncbi:MAG: flagellar motor switch protein FliG [Pseudomonadota bacterium]
MSELEAGAQSGSEKAAILLMTLGEQEASDVLRHMEPRDVQRLGLAMAGIKDITRDQAETVLDQFVTTVEEQTSLTVGTQDYIRKILTNAFGESRASALLERIISGDDAQGLDSLKWMTPESIATMIEEEHPQIIAIVLTCLDDEQAGMVASLLEPATRSDVLMRVAKLSDVQQSALAEIESLIASNSESQDLSRPAKVGGDKAAADILNAMTGKLGPETLSEITELDAELGERIQEVMFVFDSLMNVDDRGIQSLLREINNNDLSIALKGADPALCDKFFNNMSKRAATLMKEDMDAGGPVKLSEVEEAQKNIVTSARAMAESGDINLGSGGDDYV